MSGLIFLWQNIQNVPIPPIDIGKKPTMSMDKIYPTLFVENTNSVFATSFTLVNDTNALVNDPTALVGGSDLNTWCPKISAIINEVKPVLKI
jgi:hypothetical protein